MSECINFAVEPSEKEQSIQLKRYVSKHPGNLPPSYSTFNTKNGNVYVNNVGGYATLHRGQLKHHGLWGKPKFETQEELIFPVGIVPPDPPFKRNPEIWKHYKYKADPNKFKEYIQKKQEQKKRPQSCQQRKVDYMKKADFGKIPEYLEKRNQEKQQKELEEAKEKFEKEQRERQQKTKKYDIIQLITQLNKKKNDLLIEYTQYSHKRAMTQQTKLKKEEIENKINSIEKDIKKLQQCLN